MFERGAGGELGEQLLSMCGTMVHHWMEQQQTALAAICGTLTPLDVCGALTVASEHGVCVAVADYVWCTDCVCGSGWGRSARSQ